jgi:3-phenylpropionate/trans-cinnamate dioxygenase ferredoxin reductase subunit
VRSSSTGLECARGVVVDLDARSVTDPAIFAIGDVAHRPMPIYERMFCMESVPNALEQVREQGEACGHECVDEGRGDVSQVQC